MRARLLGAALAILCAAPAAAQAPNPDAEAASHVFSAFISRADPRVLSDTVRLGPALQRSLGAQTESRAVYQALLERAAGNRVRVRTLPPAEAAKHAALLGSNLDPVLALEAGDLALLMQYAPAQKRVTFVEQLAGAAPAVPRSEVPKPQPKPAPVAAPVPKPAAVAAPAAAPTPPPPAPVRAERLRPTGPCVVKPVMSDQDLANCAAAAPAPAAVRAEPPAPPPGVAPAAEKPAPPAPRAAPECVIKPVMSDEELRACGVRR